MSVELYDKLVHKHELYRLLSEAEDDFKSGNEMSFKESLRDLRQGLSYGRI